jgi:hypothetical protein
MLDHIVLNFQKTCANTLGNMIFESDFLIIGPLAKNLFSKINFNPLSPMESLQTLYTKEHRCAPILAKFHSCSTTSTHLYRLIPRILRTCAVLKKHTKD